MKDRQFSLHSCEFLLCRWKTCAWLGLTTSSVPPELLRHRYDSAQEVTSHERARTRDFNSASHTPLSPASEWGCRSRRPSRVRKNWNGIATAAARLCAPIQ